MDGLSFEERLAMVRDGTHFNCYGTAFLLRGVFDDLGCSPTSVRGFGRIKRECDRLPRVPEKSCFILATFQGILAPHVGLVVNDSGRVYDRTFYRGSFMDDLDVDSFARQFSGDGFEVQYWMHPSEIDF
ncbi:hypothetical protein CMI48_01165 [Candidatus Pacearchaeota archaeon]|nr:hypothetical protein [Candidatus Pacearchaeota archaeon]